MRIIHAPIEPIPTFFGDSPHARPHFSEWPNTCRFDIQIFERLTIAGGQNIQLFQGQVLLGFQHGLPRLAERQHPRQCRPGGPFLVRTRPVDHVPHVLEVSVNPLDVWRVSGGVVSHLEQFFDTLVMRAVQFLGLAFGLRQVQGIVCSSETVMPEHRLSPSGQTVYKRYPSKTVSVQFQPLQCHLVFIAAEVTLAGSHHLARASLVVGGRPHAQHQPWSEDGRIREFVHHFHLS